MSERVVSILFLSVYALISGAGMMLIKAGMNAWETRVRTGWLSGLLEPQIVGGMALYVAGFLLWLFLLKRQDLTVAYPAAVGALIVVTTIGGTLFLGEHFTLLRSGGISLVVAGIALLFLST